MSIYDASISTFREAFIKMGRLYMIEQFIIVFEVRNTKQLIKILQSFIHLQRRLNVHDLSSCCMAKPVSSWVVEQGSN